MKEKFRYVMNVIVTTFVIIFPQFIMKSHPIYADTIGIVLAVVVNHVFEPDWRAWKK